MCVCVYREMCLKIAKIRESNIKTATKLSRGNELHPIVRVFRPSECGSAFENDRDRDNAVSVYIGP